MYMEFIKKIIVTAFLSYALYAFLGSTIPYLLPKKVSKEYKLSSSVNRFYGDAKKPSVDRVKILETPDDAFKYRLQIIMRAQKSLDMVFHTIGSGKTVDEFFAEVIKVADRGVKVRFLLDGTVGAMGTHSKKEISYSFFNHKNIKFLLYNPFNPFNPFNWNALLHDKFIIVDNKFATLGGRNIGDKYFDPKGFKGQVSNDREVLIYNTNYKNPEDQSSSIYEIKKYMDSLYDSPYFKPVFKNLSDKKVTTGYLKHDLLLKDSENLKTKRPDIFNIPTDDDYFNMTTKTNKITLIFNPIHTRKKEPWVAYELKNLSLNSNKSVFIQTPYATANKKALNVLTKTGEKISDFKMLTNSMGSTPNFPAFSNYISNRKKFINTGVKIYEYQGDSASLHSKTYLFDDNISVIGSFNLDDRSIYIDTETMLVIDSKAFNEIATNTIKTYKDNSLVVDKNNKYLPSDNVTPLKPSGLKYILMWIASIFSRLLQFLI